MGKKLYWDGVNGKVTNDDKWAEIYCVKGCDGYVETYKIDDYSYIDFAYTKMQKRFGLYFYREAFLKKNRLKDSDLYELVRLCIPEDVYENMMDRYSYLLTDNEGEKVKHDE